MQKMLMAGGIAAVLALGAGTAKAAVVEVKVPFAFKVEGKTMPAGTYRIETQGQLAQLENETQHVSLFVLTRSTETLDSHGKGPALAFTHSKDGYTLSDIRVSASQDLEVAH